MPKKKGIWKSISSDFTLNDSANAPKPVTRLRKSHSADTTESSWDEISTDNIVKEINADGSKKKKNNGAETYYDIANRPGIEYPEILFYLISAYIEPEQIASFASINKAAYACTKRETFWRNLYKTYCHNHPRLPPRLRIENSFKVYGLRQRVIRALHHTYDPFVWKIGQEALQDCQPHELVRRRCVNVWYSKGLIHWLVFFKFKKRQLQRPEVVENMIEELGRIDANPDEDCQVLQVTCHSFSEVPPVMGMTLTSVSMFLADGFMHHKLHLGFSTSSHNISRHTIPEKSVVIDTVINTFVFDWWHPKYPHFDNKVPLPLHINEERSWEVSRYDFLRPRGNNFE